MNLLDEDSLHDLTQQELDRYVNSACDDDFAVIYRDIKYLKSVEESVKKLLSKIEQMIDDYKAIDPDELGKSLLSMVSLAESIISKIRTIPMQFGFPYKKHVDDIVREYADVKLEYMDDNILHIIMPALLPKFKTVGNEVNTTLFRNTYQMAFEKFFVNRRYNPYNEPVVVIFYHHYRRGVLPRDHDNMETKAILDVIATFTLPSDNPHWVETYSLSGDAEEESYTEIFVVPESHFTELYFKLKKEQNKKYKDTVESLANSLEMIDHK